MERQTYTYDEAFEASLQYFKGDELAAGLGKQICSKDSFGTFSEKSPEDMHWRIANEVARIEAKYKNGLNAHYLRTSAGICTVVKTGAFAKRYSGTCR